MLPSFPTSSKATCGRSGFDTRGFDGPKSLKQAVTAPLLNYEYHGFSDIIIKTKVPFHSSYDTLKNPRRSMALSPE